MQVLGKDLEVEECHVKTIIVFFISFTTSLVDRILWWTNLGVDITIYSKLCSTATFETWIEWFLPSENI